VAAFAVALGVAAPDVAFGQGEGAADPCREGAALFEHGDYAAAEPQLQRCLASGENLQPLVSLAAIASLSQRPKLAQEYARRAVELDAASAEARYWLGRAALEQGDRAAAESEWEIGLGLSTEHPGILEGLARLAAERGQSAKAYGLLTQLVRQGVDEAWVHRMLADLSRQKGLWSEALRHWRDALARGGEDQGSLLTAGELAILAGDTAGAVAACRKAVDLSPDAASLGGLGEALFATHRYGEAARVLRRAVELAPDQARHRFNLANVLELLDQPDEAEEHFRRYVELEPDDPLGRFNYAIHLDKQGRTDAALAQVEVACARGPRMLTARVVRAQLLEKLGRLEETLAVIDSLMVRDAENGETLAAWRQNVADKLAVEGVPPRPGQVLLLHIVTGDTVAARLVERELRDGVDFRLVATRYSAGSTAARGGEIGYVAPQDMVEPLRSAIAALRPNETSPLVQAGGLYHCFKRLR
jgi:tetratricopeptide (TPR) repeat protein